MKLVLIGYGKMGQAVAEAAKSRGHEIVLTINSQNSQELTSANLKQADAAIEFSQPQLARLHVARCLEAGVPVVCGTTGWNEELKQLSQHMRESGQGSMVYASNFSIGVNIFFEINKQLAALMQAHPEYEPSITETHHIQKKDVPSGTALSLAEQMLEHMPHKTRWALNDANDTRVLPVFAHRREDITGIHCVRYHSEVDDIEITHRAHSRKGFALGAVLAAEFVVKQKPGVYGMADVLHLNGR